MKVGIIGCGPMGLHHARVIREFDFVSEVTGCDILEAARRRAEEEGFRAVPDIPALLAEGPAAAVVVTSPVTHAAAIRPCLQAGVPVLTEKPLSTDVEEGAELVALAEAKGLSFQVGFELRYCGLTRGMKAVVGSGLIGEPRHMMLVQMSGPKTEPGRMVKERVGGIFYEKLCHQVDLFRFWFGEPDRIMAVSGPRVLGHYGIPDNVLSCTKFPGGETGTVAFITTRAAQAGGTDDHGDRGHFYELVLTCSRGSVTFDHWTSTLEVVRFNHRDDNRNELVESVNVGEKYGEPSYDLASQDGDFLRRVRDGIEPLFPASDAQKSMEWVRRAEESLAAGGEWVSV